MVEAVQMYWKKNLILNYVNIRMPMNGIEAVENLKISFAHKCIILSCTDPRKLSLNSVSAWR